MKKIRHPDLIQLCDLLAAHKRISHWRVSALVRGDGQFFKRLKGGKQCLPETSETVVQGFSNIWPDDLDWPVKIHRPDPCTEKEKA